MVLLIIIPFLNGYFIGNIPNIFRQTHIDYLYIYLSGYAGYIGYYGLFIPKSQNPY